MEQARGGIYRPHGECFPVEHHPNPEKKAAADALRAMLITFRAVLIPSFVARN